MNFERIMTVGISLAALVAFGAFLHAVLKLPVTGPTHPDDATTILILDVGHGGIDPGAQSIWMRPRGWEDSPNSLTLTEHSLCFDVAARIVKLLEREPGVAVVPVLVDTLFGFRVQDVAVPPFLRTQALLTSPIYDLNTNHYKASVNLRWMIANSRLRELNEARRLDGKSLIFMSIHADARQGDDVEGLTIYIPRGPAVSPEPVRLGFYSRYRDRENATPDRRPLLGNDDQTDSRRLARAIVTEFRERDLPVIGYLPIRSRIDGGHSPAVLLHNWTPCRILLELGNLTDPDDQDRITDPQCRQQMAEAIAKAVLAAGTPVRSEGYNPHRPIP